MTDRIDGISMSGISHTSRCAGQVRFVKHPDGTRVIQQLWKVTTYNDGKAWSINHEWRDVPTVKVGHD